MRLVGSCLKSNIYLFISEFFLSHTYLYCFWKYSFLILNIGYGSLWSKISSVLMTLKCINLVEMLELTWTICVLPFLDGLVTCYCMEKVCKMFLYLFVDSFWWFSKLMLKSPVNIRIPLLVVCVLARNSLNVSSHLSFSTSTELCWFTAQTKGWGVFISPMDFYHVDFKICVISSNISLHLVLKLLF